MTNAERKKKREEMQKEYIERTRKGLCRKGGIPLEMMGRQIMVPASEHSRIVQRRMKAYRIILEKRQGNEEKRRDTTCLLQWLDRAQQDVRDFMKQKTIQLHDLEKVYDYKKRSKEGEDQKDEKRGRAQDAKAKTTENKRSERTKMRRNIEDLRRQLGGQNIQDPTINRALESMEKGAETMEGTPDLIKRILTLEGKEDSDSNPPSKRAVRGSPIGEEDLAIEEMTWCQPCTLNFDSEEDRTTGREKREGEERVGTKIDTKPTSSSSSGV